MDIELQITRIYENDQMIGYGGNQDWFLETWAQKAGCASVLASNLYAYYSHITKIEKHAFLAIMNQMFECFTPGKMGYPFLYKFARTFCQVMKDKQVYFQPVYMKQPQSYQQAKDFVMKSLLDKHPVGLLILHHQSPQLEDDNWHWVCITGWKQYENQETVIFSDCGQRREIDARILFDIQPQNIMKMMRMKNSPQP